MYRLEACSTPSSRSALYLRQSAGEEVVVRRQLVSGKGNEKMKKRPASEAKLSYGGGTDAVEQHRCLWIVRRRPGTSTAARRGQQVRGNDKCDRARKGRAGLTRA